MSRSAHMMLVVWRTVWLGGVRADERVAEYSRRVPCHHEQQCRRGALTHSRGRMPALPRAVRHTESADIDDAVLRVRQLRVAMARGSELADRSRRNGR